MVWLEKTDFGGYEVIRKEALLGSPLGILKEEASISINRFQRTVGKKSLQLNAVIQPLNPDLRCNRKALGATPWS
jgi:hypothetical protein